MREITQQAAQAFVDQRNFESGNTVVAASSGGITCLILHDNYIATHIEGDGLYVSTCGWNTPTTRERLNGLPGVNVNVAKGQLYLNDVEWDGKTVRVES